MNDPQTTVKDRLVQFINHLRISTRAFEIACGFSNGFVKNISRGIGADKMRSILQTYPQLNSDWLITGEGEMLRPVVSQQVGDIDGDARNINVYNSDAAYTTLLKIVESHQSTTDSLIDLFKSQQAQSNKQMEQTDKLISLLQAVIERAK